MHAPDQPLDANCPHRLLIDQVTDKWSILILTALEEDAMRFNALKRRLLGVTQKALTATLRRLERNGLIARRVVSFSPVAVEYGISPLGRTLLPPFLALYAWTVESLPAVEDARLRFDDAGRNVEVEPLAA